MAESIAKGNVQLTADGGQIDKDLSAVQSRLRAFQNYANEQLKLRAPSLLQNASAFALGGLAVSGIRTAFSTVTTSLQNTRREIAQAKGLGFSSDFFAGISMQARTVGVDLEESSRGFTHYQQLIGEALGGNEQAEATFRRLGISVAQLNSQSPEQTFRQVATAVDSLGNPLDKAVAKIELFGTKNASLGRIFTGGSEGLSQAQQVARQSGLSMSQAQADSVEKAVRAWTAASARVDAAWSSTIRGWSAQAAPILEMLAKALEGGTSEAGRQGQSWVQALPRAAALVVAEVGDKILEGLATLGTWILDIVTHLKEELGKTLSPAGGLTRVLANAIPGANFALDQIQSTPTSDLNGLSTTLRSFLSDRQAGAWRTNLEKIFEAFDLRMTNAARPPQSESQILEQRGRAFRDQLEMTNRYLGYSTEEIERERLARAGLRREILADIDEQLAERHALQQFGDMLQDIEHQRQEGRQLTEQLSSPMETFRRTVDQLNERRRLGFIDDTTHARGQAQAFAQLAQSIQQSHMSPAAYAGSEEAARILQAVRSEQRQRPEDMVRQVLEQALDQERQQLAVQQQIRDSINLWLNRVVNPRNFGQGVSQRADFNRGLDYYGAWGRPTALNPGGPNPFTSVGGEIGPRPTVSTPQAPPPPPVPGTTNPLVLPNTPLLPPVVPATPVVNPYLPTSGGTSALVTTGEQTVSALRALLALQQSQAQAAAAPPSNPYLEVQIVD